jgi:hypothetical protein
MKTMLRRMARRMVAVGLALVSSACAIAAWQAGRAAFEAVTNVGGPRPLAAIALAGMAAGLAMASMKLMARTADIERSLWIPGD